MVKDDLGMVRYHDQSPDPSLHMSGSGWKRRSLPPSPENLGLEVQCGKYSIHSELGGTAQQVFKHLDTGPHTLHLADYPNAGASDDCVAFQKRSASAINSHIRGNEVSVW